MRSPRSAIALSLAVCAGDNQVTLTWGKAPENGSKITKYVVTGDGQIRD